MTEWQTKGRDATGGTVEGSSMEDSVVINFRKPLVNVYVDPIDEDSRSNLKGRLRLSLAVEKGSALGPRFEKRSPVAFALSMYLSRPI